MNGKKSLILMVKLTKCNRRLNNLTQRIEFSSGVITIGVFFNIAKIILLYCKFPNLRAKNA